MTQQDMNTGVITADTFEVIDAPDDVDHGERTGLDCELWACRRLDSPLVHHRTRWWDAIDARTWDPVEIKSCKKWYPSVQSEGQWRLRRPQHENLKRQGGYYLLLVYTDQPTQNNHQLHLNYAITITPQEIESRCGSELLWRSHRHPSLGLIRITDLSWPQILSETEDDVRDLFTRYPQPII